jgi:hypothetical protein
MGVLFMVVFVVVFMPGVFMPGVSESFECLVPCIL